MTLSPDEIRLHAESSHKATVIISKFVDDEIVPILQSVVTTTAAEEAMIGLYYRLVLLARSMTMLDDPQHFQTVRSTARTAFELFLDVDQLAKDSLLADKFFAYTTVAKYDSARKLIDALDKHPNIDPHRYRHQRASLTMPPARKNTRILSISIGHRRTGRGSPRITGLEKTSQREQKRQVPSSK